MRDKTTKLFYAALFLVGVFLLFQPPIDPDFGWHFKYGEYLFKNHALLKQNVFSYTFTNYEWANSYWVAELVLYVLYTYMGAIGTGLILSAAMSGAFLILLHKLNIGEFGKTIAAIVFFALAGAAYTAVRPFYFSTLYLLLLAYILLYKKNWQWVLPFVFLVWANTHADFTLGLFVYAAFTVWQLVQKNFKAAVIPIVTVLATLINPYGIKLWTTLFKETHYFQFNYIAEWLPTNYWVLLLLAAFLFASVILAHVLDNKRFGVWYVVACSVFFLLSFRSVYFVRVLAAFSVISVAVSWDFILELARKFVEAKTQIILRPIFAAFIILLILISSDGFVKNVELASDISKWAGAKNFPYEAVLYLQKNKPEGNLLNLYGWGGFLIWQLPEYKTFIDGRMPSWRENGESVFEDYVAITRSPNQNKDLLDSYIEKYNIRQVLDKKDAALVNYLLATGEWQKLQETESYVLIAK